MFPSPHFASRSNPDGPPGLHFQSSPEREGLPRAAVRVLVVDDERDAVLTLLELVREEGYDARGGYRGKEVLQLMRDFQPHAVLLDIGMPDVTGYEVARRIRERYGNATPLLIAVTAWKKSSDLILAGLAGFDHHVAKPYEPDALLKLLAPLKTPN